MEKIMTDTELLSWLEKQSGVALINDDAGRWAVSFDGMQNIPDNDKATFISTSFFIEANQWKPTIREAIEAANDEIQRGDI